MIRLYADFNSATQADQYYILYIDGVFLGETNHDFGLKEGDTVELYQDVGDFIVSAHIYKKYVEELGRITWIAVPDWDTKKAYL